MNMIEDILKRRKQIKVYSKDNVPSKEMVETLLSKAYDCVASKQNLVPYKIHVLDKSKKEAKNLLYKLSSSTKGGNKNHELQAPYVLVFTKRLVDKPNPETQRKINLGHDYPLTDPKRYKDYEADVAIEIGMFAKTLSALCLEKGLDVSYILCLSNNNDERWKDEKLKFIDDEIMFAMALGYKHTNQDNPFWRDKKHNEYKPEIKDIINWH